MIDLSTIEARKAMAGKYATKYSLDVTLLCAWIDHESSWNPWAIRYEPAFYDRYILPLVTNGTIKTATEAQARSMSWGLAQIMGEVAREFGFKGQFLSELSDPDTGLDFACKKLQRCFTVASQDVDKALLCYNGGGDPSYPGAVRALLEKYA
jgi:soluble lytic murein transglycosylase-like protein